MQTELHERIADALYGDNGADREQRKLQLLAKIDGIKQLIHEGRLGCVIVTELVTARGSSLVTNQYGDPELIFKTAKRLVNQARSPAAALEHAAAQNQPPDPSEIAA